MEGFVRRTANLSMRIPFRPRFAIQNPLPQRDANQQHSQMLRIRSGTSHFDSLEDIKPRFAKTGLFAFH